MRRMSYRMSMKVADNIKHFYKSERDIVALIKKSEPLTNENIDELMNLAN